MVFNLRFGVLAIPVLKNTAPVKLAASIRPTKPLVQLLLTGTYESPRGTRWMARVPRYRLVRCRLWRATWQMALVQHCPWSSVVHISRWHIHTANCTCGWQFAADWQRPGAGCHWRHSPTCAISAVGLSTDNMRLPAEDYGESKPGAAAPG